MRLAELLAERLGTLISWLTHSRIGIVLALTFVLAGISLTGLRITRQYSAPTSSFDLEKTGMSDFHNGIYLPSLAFRNGVNPYSHEAVEQYKLARAAPPYSPSLFIFYSPLTYLSAKTADVVYFAFAVTLLGLVAFLGISMSGTKFRLAPWLWLLGLLIFSRPGHITLYTGYFTTQLVIGTLMAIHFARSRPLVSGIGMLIASGKPTYIVPLILLMLFRRNYKAVAIGIAFCAVGAAIGIAWLASFSSINDVVAGIQEGQSAFQDDTTEDPVNTWTRLDIAGVVSQVMEWKPDSKTYLSIMMGLIVIPGIAIRIASLNETNHGATGLSGMLVCLAILTTIYHHSYDGMLVAVAWFAVSFFPKTACSDLSNRTRLALVGLLGFPAINYFSTLRFRGLLGIENQAPIWKLIISLNGACLLAAMLILAWSALRQSKTQTRMGQK